MGKPKKIKPSLIDTSYDWGDFGSANQSGVGLSPAASANVTASQSGINQYVNEMLNPSYSSEVFGARQNLLNRENTQRANTLLANALGKNARGSASQAIINNILANRVSGLQNAMSEEDARVQNTLSALSGVEGNYFNQSNAMARDILSRVLGNQQAKNEANQRNAQAYNAWRDNLWQGTGGAIGAAIGAYFGGGAGAGVGAQAGTSAGGMLESLGN